MTVNDLLGDLSPLVKLACYYVAAIVGMICHWLKSHLNEQTQSTMREWFAEDGKKTALTAVSVLGTSLPAIAPLDLTTTPVLTFITMGFGLGFASDSAFNSETPTDNTERK
jgi:uncharacterized membrane protein YdjX (TVP38/TMEM64 family)